MNRNLGAILILGLLWTLCIISIYQLHAFPWIYYLILSITGYLAIVFFILYFNKRIQQLEKNISTYELNKNELLSNKELLGQLEHFDALTSLPTRIYFRQAMQRALTHAARYKKMLALLHIKIDHLPNEADNLIQEIATRITTILRKGDIVARLTEDQFAILINDLVHPKYAGPVAEKILRAIHAPYNINSQEFNLTASIGISIYPSDGTTPEKIEETADTALLTAKQSGGNVFKFFTKEMDIHVHEHVQMQSALRNSIPKNELTLYFQPQFEIKSNKLAGIETLIRWQHPEQGLILPDQFIPLAEESGLIIQIGEWALHEACRIYQSWLKENYQPVQLSINISAKQFHHQNIAKLLKPLLQDYQIPASCLQLEITETTAMENVAITAEKLKEIHALGVCIGIDDFGTGYTSIGHLKHFPIHTLKIDQSFIKDIPKSPDDMAITIAIISLAHNLGIKVVGEGVETQEQLQFLRRHDCDIAQGFLFGKPLTQDQIIKYFTKR